MSEFALREMTLSDYAVVYSLWQATPGVGLSNADSRPAMASFLERNPGLSWVATRGEAIVGVVLCGHDGRRGHMYHLVVVEQYRRQGLGRLLVGCCLARLQRLGIEKCNVQLFSDNESGHAFWKGIGWAERVDLSLMQRMTSG